MLSSITQKIEDNILAQKDILPVWLPVLFGVGIAIYFSLKFEPAIFYSAAVIIILMIFAIIFRNNKLINIIFIAFITIACGFFTANFRTINVAAPVIKKETRPVNITATIEEIHPKTHGTQILFKDVYISGFEAQETPKKIRLNVKTKDNGAAIGDKISTLALLSPPPSEVIPGDYNFSLYSYFQQIGAVGYTIADINILQKKEQNSFEIFVQNLRRSITNKILDKNIPSESSVATALIVGEQGAIPQKDQDNMKVAGTFHIISISGLHLSLAAMIFFLGARYILLLFPSISLAHNTKKIAAIIAIFSSGFYLLISGVPVPAQRSFITTTMILLAIIFDKTAISMRSIAVAAIVVLAIAPESILTPSFQMSFSAAAALVSCFIFLKPMFREVNNYGLISKIFAYFFSIVISSLIASLATTPFSIYHFNYFSAYGIVANLIAVPITSFIIMPFEILALFLMPFDLQDIALKPAFYGIHLMLKSAEYIASFPQPFSTIKSMSNTSFVLIIFGGIWLLIWQSKIRLYGLAPAIIGIILIFFTKTPDIIISQKGNLFALKGDDSQIFFSSMTSERYARTKWQKTLGLRTAMNIKTMPSCDYFGCLYNKNGYTTLIAKHPIALVEDCKNADILVNLTHQNKICDAAVSINLYDLKNKGTHTIYLGDYLEIKNVHDSIGNRPWN